MTPGFIMSTSSVINGRCCADAAIAETAISNTARNNLQGISAISHSQYLLNLTRDFMDRPQVCQITRQALKPKLILCALTHIRDALSLLLLFKSTKGGI